MPEETELYIMTFDPGTDFPQALKNTYSAIEWYVYTTGDGDTDEVLVRFMSDVLEFCNPEDFNWDTATEGIGSHMIRLESEVLDEGTWKRIRKIALGHKLFIFDGIHKKFFRP